jgi:hypothetical protein
MFAAAICFVVGDLAFGYDSSPRGELILVCFPATHEARSPGVYKFLHSSLQAFEIAVRTRVDFFPFEGLQKTLARRIVIWVRGSALSDLDWSHLE